MSNEAGSQKKQAGNCTAYHINSYPIGMENKLIVGVDIGKSTHYATILDCAGHKVGGVIKFANSLKGGQLLLERVLSVKSQDQRLIFGLEATGHYWLPLYSFLTEKGFSVYVINPYQSDAWRKMLLSSTKTDKEDSFVIADIIRFGHHEETKLADERMIALKNLCRFRINLQQQVTDSKRRVITILDQIFPEFAPLFSNVFGKTAQAILDTASTPQEIESISAYKLTNLVKKVSRGRFGKEKALELKSCAANSFGIKMALDTFQLQLELLLEQVSFLESQLNRIEQKISTLVKEINSVLTTLPGVGQVIAATIIAEIGDIKRFRNSSQLVSYAGINPTVRQSGSFMGNKNQMSKKGSPYLRLALWQASVTSIRFNPILKSYYEKKIKEGKNHMTVIGAVSRKLTGIIFSMLKNNKPFSFDRAL